MRDSDAPHPGGFGRFHTVNRIFDDGADRRLRAKLSRRGQEDVRCGFLLRNVVAGHNGVPAFRREADLVQVGVDLDEVGAGGDCDFQPGRLARADQFHRARKRPQLRGHQFQIDLVGAFLGVRQVERNAVLVRHPADVTVFTRTDEWQEILRLHGNPFLAEHGDRSGVNQRL